MATKSKTVLAGVNDLATIDPAVAAEWDYERNGDLEPSMVIPSSTKKVWWKCKKGHEWSSTVYSRVRGNGCPICAAKKDAK